MRYGSTKDRDVTLIRALLYGDSGVGKTTSLATLPPAQTLIATAERGLLPLRRSNFSVAVIESWQDVRELCGKMSDPVAFLSQLRGNGGLEELKILAIDSLYECSELCKAQIVGEDRKALMESRKGADGKGKALGIYDDLMGMEDWNLYQTRMKGMLSAFCHLPVHVIFTDLSQVADNKKTGEKGWITPALHGQLAFTVPSHFDLVMRMESIDQPDAEGKMVNARVWRTFNDGQIIAKDGTGCGLASYEQANWTKLFGKILGAKESK